MSFPRKLLVVLLLLAACTTAERAAREPAPAAEPAPEAAAATPEPAPPPAPATSAYEQVRRIEEEVERVGLPPPAPEAAPAGSVFEVLFDAGGATLTAVSRSVLDRMSDGLPDGRADYYLEIQGHTDPSGSEESNRRLAERRAEAVRRYLNGERGVPIDAMGIVPLGSSAPAADNRTAEGRERNRRAVVVLLLPPP